MTESTKNAIAVIDGATQKGALAYISREDCMNVTPLYKPEVTVIQLRLPKSQYDKDSDVYDISGKYMPKREVVDRIGEASGLAFVREGCRTWTEERDDDIAGRRTVYISEQQARRRMSDGSWRTSSVQAYEFDPVLRAMVDYNVVELTPQTKQEKNRSGRTLAQTILEFTKVARQRAETGARLRVIRELTNMPTAFSKTDAAKPLVFGRFAQNTDYILQTPEGRAMASAQALGVDVAALFGGRAAHAQSLADARRVTAEADEAAGPQDAVQEAPALGLPQSDTSASGAEPSAPLETQGADASALADQALGGGQDAGGEFDSLTSALEQWAEEYKEILNVTQKNGTNPYQAVQAELDAGNFNATVESRKSMIDRVKAFLAARGVRL